MFLGLKLLWLERKLSLPFSLRPLPDQHCGFCSTVATITMAVTGGWGERKQRKKERKKNRMLPTASDH